MRGTKAAWIGAAWIGTFLALASALPAWAGEVAISVNKSTQRMTVSVDGVERYSWPVSTGMSGYATPAGAYTPSRLAKEHYSKEWDDAPMPHSIFFTDAGHAIHGSQAVARLGTPASHGCVRLAPAKAGTLFNLVMAEGLNNTRVEVFGDEPIGSDFAGGSGAPGNYNRLTSFDPLVVGIMAGAPVLPMRPDPRLRP